MRKHTIFLLTCLLLSFIIFAQAGFKIGQKVEVKWKDRWYKSTVLEVKGNTYKIHYDDYDSSWDETVTATRIRKTDRSNSADGTKGATSKTSIKFGKYGCTATKYNNGFYEFLPKGSFVITKNGTYTYYGFSQPSKGTTKVDAATGVIRFRGGYFNNGEATPIEGSENRYYLVFPTIPDNRWTCGLIEEKQ